MLSDFFSLLYPNLCAGCGTNLNKSETAICTGCRYEFPYIRVDNPKDNCVTNIFTGRIPVTFGYSLVSFNKGHRIQSVLHELKYKGNRLAGEELGRMLGGEIKTLPIQPDFIIPIPLHPKKQRKRGYNQAEVIATGVSEITGIPVNLAAIKRGIFTTTQTSKSRSDRWTNVETAFETGDVSTIQDKHVLIVDDVLTTGATIEACASILLKAGAKKISIATVACVI